MDIGDLCQVSQVVTIDLEISLELSFERHLLLLWVRLFVERFRWLMIITHQSECQKFF